MVETVTCVHCGAVAKHPVTKVIQGQALTFCCNGCVEVYEMMLAEGLVEVPKTQPAPSAPLPDKNGASETISFHVSGMSCDNCVATVGRHLRAVPGVLDVNVRLDVEQATVQWIPGQVDMTDLQRAVENAGYSLVREL
jgi:copper chaperone CopZ